MNKNTPLYPLSRSSFIPHYMSDEIFSDTVLQGYSPYQLRNVYGFDQSIRADDIKIAVICAFDNVALQYNVEEFCRYFSLEVPEISVFYPQGRAQITTDSWITESSLDVQWISVFAPGAQIMCVFAQNALTDSMLSAVEYAKTLSPDVICMCFGTQESASFSQSNSIFQDEGIIFVASCGNTSAVADFPSTSPYVLSVGATELVLDNRNRRISESVWRNTGSGISDLFNIPEYQRIFQPIQSLTGGKRGVPDVSFCGSREYGASIYVSQRGGWTSAGGTSLACACVSGICACVAKSNPYVKNEGIHKYFYSLAGKTSYNIPQYYFYDIIFGSNARFSAMEGWDLCTGLGSVTSKTAKNNEELFYS